MRLNPLPDDDREEADEPRCLQSVPLHTPGCLTASSYDEDMTFIFQTYPFFVFILVDGKGRRVAAASENNKICCCNTPYNLKKKSSSAKIGCPWIWAWLLLASSPFQGKWGRVRRQARTGTTINRAEPCCRSDGEERRRRGHEDFRCDRPILHPEKTTVMVVSRRRFSRSMTRCRRAVLMS